MQQTNNRKETRENDSRGRDPSKTAETLAIIRAMESRKPEEERIYYDPYAFYFISRETMEYYSSHTAEARAMLEQSERLVPGVGVSCLVRARYFDDVVKASITDGLEQLVVLGAGYDSRAYRIEGLERVRVFEVDVPTTQKLKTDKVREIFGVLPGHVTYVPADLAVDDLGQRLAESGYDTSRKTLFLLEGLVYYLPPTAVDKVLAFIAHSSGRGSAMVFDYIPASLVDGTCEQEAGRNWQKAVTDAGEPFLFGVDEVALEAFLSERGFTLRQKMTGGDYRTAYLRGKNEGKPVNSLLSFAYAAVR
ncbi:TPA: class I SAM-dependent methyltransferase [Methanosarcina acetivorans]|uniref:Methyltransferase n=2 Tax=Methanosarcina acetivorans TaxID=2214 RepID=Q8TMB9_METAC|nr:class I SAM-dependent methyltransferase [Methanosarcina acetivorans]AAM06123.1 conserved hypothetical protein [Methanosarcina acetivorans C2A]HIH92482.1 class I SAM-dependent methyltransferase [Methanosarcina acetivorans]